MTRTFPLGVTRDKKETVPPEHHATGRRQPVAPADIPKVLGLTNGRHAAAEEAGDWNPAAIEPRYRNPRIKVAGFGGQGVLFLGTVIAEAGMLSGRGVSWLPSYGPEMRGGTAHCHVMMNDGEVDSPLVSQATVLFAFNSPSLKKFAGDVAEGGMVVYDSGLITDPPPMPGREVLALPATSIAERCGSARMANIVALGAWIGRTQNLPLFAVKAALMDHGLRPDKVEQNLKALEEGMRFRP